MRDGAACTNPTSSAPPHMAGRVLRATEFVQFASYDSTAPCEQLAPWVHRYWSVQADLPAGVTYPVMTVEEPAFNLTVERGGIRRHGATNGDYWLTGPAFGRRFSAQLTGVSHTLGVLFHVGGIAAFTRREPAALIGRTAPADEWLPGISAALRDISGSATECAASLDALLLDRDPQPSADYDEFRRIHALLSEPDVLRVETLAARAGRTERTVQRLFRSFAGVGPKRLLIRARVHDTIAAMEARDGRSLAEIAAAHGWSDQAHWAREFRALTGQSPSDYVAGRPPSS